LASRAPLSISGRTRCSYALSTGIVFMLCCVPVLAQERSADGLAADGFANVEATPAMLDIPSQPLEAALKAFAAATRIALFYESSVVAGRRSFAVRGALPAEAALHVMLQGTGLSGRSFDRGTITILAPAKDDQATELRHAKASIAEFSLYLALVQQRLDRAFCLAPIAPGDPDRFLARLWISPSGNVAHADLLSSAGSDHRDYVYKKVLAALTIRAPPPTHMPQPINLMITPRKPTSVGCLTLGADARSAVYE
jgi:hypothetical protein